MAQRQQAKAKASANNGKEQWQHKHTVKLHQRKVFTGWLQVLHLAGLFGFLNS